MQMSKCKVQSEEADSAQRHDDTSRSNQGTKNPNKQSTAKQQKTQTFGIWDLISCLAVGYLNIGCFCPKTKISGPPECDFFVTF
jgi:hypothetical protein